MKIKLPPLKYSVPLVIFIFNFFLLLSNLKYNYDSEKENMQFHLVNESKDQIILLSSIIETNLRENNKAGADDIINHVSAFRDVELVLLINENNRIIASNEYRLINKRINEVLKIDIVDKIKGSESVSFIDESEESIYAIVELYVGKSQNSLLPDLIGKIITKKSLYETMQRQNANFIKSLISNSLVFLVFSFFLWLFFHIALNRRISLFLSGIKQRKRLEISGKDEISLLAKGFYDLWEELSEKEYKFRNLYESMEQGVTYQNSDGIILDANPAAQKILGLNLEQLKGRTSIDPRWKSIHEDGSEFPGETHPSILALKTGKPILGEIMGVYNPVDDSNKWIKIDAIPQFKEGETKPHQVFTTFEDITENKNAEMKLKENESRYIKSQKLGKVGNWEYNLETHKFWASDEAKRIFGFSPTEKYFSVEVVESCIPERERVHQALIDLIKNHKEYNLEYNVEPRNGDDLKIVNSIAELQYDNSGKPTKVIGVILDITEQKRNVNSLRRNEELLNETGKISKVGGFELNLKTMTPFFTNETFNIYELPIGQIPPVEEGINFYAEEARPIIKKAVQEAIESGKSYDIEVPFITAKGKKLWVRTLGHVKYANGIPSHLVGTIQDITQKRASEESLRLKEALLEASQELAKTGGWQWDVIKEQMYWTDQTFKIHDLEKKDFINDSQKIIGMSVECYLPEDRQKVMDGFNRCVQTGESYDDIMQFTSTKGRKLWIRSTAKAVWENDKITKVIGAVQDVTELTLAHLDLKKSEEKFRSYVSKATEGIYLGEFDEPIDLSLSVEEQAKLMYKNVYISDCNDAFAKIYGLEKAADAIGMRQADAHGIEENPANLEFLKKLALSNYTVKDVITEEYNVTGDKLYISNNTFGIIENNKLVKIWASQLDVTAKVEAETKLKESEEKFYKIFKNSPESIILTRLSDFKIVDANDSSHKITGYTLEELTSMNTNELEIWKYKDDRKNYLEQLTAKGYVKNYEAEFITKSGENRIWLASAEIIQINNENYVLEILKDITQLRLAESELKRQTEFITVLIDNQPSGVVACDANGRLVTFNKIAKEWHGVDSADIPQERWAEYYGLYDKNGDKKLSASEIPLLIALHGKKLTNYEMVIKVKDKEPRLVSCYGSGFSDINGKKLGALVVMNDITMERYNENELKRSEYLLNEAGKMADIGAWEYDLKTDKTRWSNQVFELHSIPIGEVPSFDEIMKFYVDGSEEVLRKAVEDCIKLKKTYELELRFENAKKEKLWVRALGYPILNEENNVEKIRGVIQNITKQKKSEEELKDVQNELRALFSNLDKLMEEEKSALARELHDELGQVLTSIAMNLNLLHKSIDEVDYDQEYLLREVSEMEEIIKKSKINIKKLILTLRPEYLDNFGIYEAVNHAVKDFEKNYSAKVQFNCNFTRINLSQQKENVVFRIIQESLTNVAKHSAATKVEINMLIDENNLEVSILDNGKGISKDDYGKQKSLGLLGMRERLASIGSKLIIESELNIGTQIKFSIKVDNEDPS